jgi:hypothetical protein
VRFYLAVSLLLVRGGDCARTLVTPASQGVPKNNVAFPEKCANIEWNASWCLGLCGHSVCGHQKWRLARLNQKLPEEPCRVIQVLQQRSFGT